MRAVDDGGGGDVDVEGGGWGGVFVVVIVVVVVDYGGEGRWGGMWFHVVGGVGVEGGGRGCVWWGWRWGWRLLLEGGEHGEEETGLGGEMVGGKHCTTIYGVMGQGSVLIGERVHRMRRG